jgi:heat shock protein HslJ
MGSSFLPLESPATTHMKKIKMISIMAFVVCSAGLLTASASDGPVPTAKTAPAMTLKKLCSTKWQGLKTKPKGDESSLYAESTIEFKEDGTFSARLCNLLNGKYVYDAATQTLTIEGPVTATRMACMGTMMKDEGAFLKNKSFKVTAKQGVLSLEGEGAVYSWSAM